MSQNTRGLLPPSTAALRRSTVRFWGCFSREVNGAVGNDASKKKRHNPLDVKGSSDFSLLSKLWRGQERSRAHPQPVDAALDSDALALDVAWGRGRAGSLFPEAWLQRTGSQGRRAPMRSQKQFRCGQQTQGAQGCTRRAAAAGEQHGPTFPSAFERSRNPISFLGSLPLSGLVHGLP